MARNIIDMPVGENENSKDQLELDKYITGLSEFIKTCDMPTTIAIQGEWGSGKTSMMNLLKTRLCRTLHKVSEDDAKEERPYYGIWINVWKYSLMKTPEMTLLTVLSAMTEEIVQHMKYRHEDSMHKVISNVGSVVGKFLKVTTNLGINFASNSLGVGSLVNNLSGSDDESGSVLSPDAIQKMLKNAINDFIEAESEISKRNNTQPARGFLFFIDDLDRMEPAIAVSLLELLKNIFEVSNCVFVLAIDYDVVVRGLRAKFGDQKISADNERQYRSFFDKIIQLPFNMPQNNYNIEKFLKEGLNSIGYFDGNRFSHLKDDEVLKKLSRLVELSTGRNPRSIIRLINSLSLINIMQNQINKKEKISDEEEILNFGLICMQIAYQRIYRLLQQYPDFSTEWEESFDEIIRKFDLRSLNEGERGTTAAENSENALSEEDEEDKRFKPWDPLIDAICIDDVYLKRHRADISEMLTIFSSLFANDPDKIGDHVNSVLKISAVTSVSNAKSGNEDSTLENKKELNIVQSSASDPIEQYCELIRNHFKDSKEKEKVEKSIELYKTFLLDLKEKYKDLIYFECKSGITVRVSNRLTKSKNIGWTYSYDYIRPGKFSFGMAGSGTKSYSSLEELGSNFYDDFNKVFNELSKVKVYINDGQYIKVETNSPVKVASPAVERSAIEGTGNISAQVPNLLEARLSFEDDYSNVVSVSKFEFEGQSFDTSRFSDLLHQLIVCLESKNHAKLEELADSGFKLSDSGRSKRFYILRTGEGMINPHEFPGEIFVEFNMSGPTILAFAIRLLDAFGIDKSQVFYTAKITEV